ncbi:MAG: hypothetical protein WBL50_19800 [Candidatus Acidiferrum sp.]
MTSSKSWTRIGLVFAIGTVSTVFVLSAGAQVQTKTTIREGPSSEVVRVDRGEVLAVEGNDLIVRMEDGSIRNFEDIPKSSKVTVDGKQLGIHDLKPGMKLQRTMTTTTTPQIVTTVETVTGKVWHVTPPLSVILALENGTNQTFKIPKDQKFNVNGQMVDAFGLRKGMVVTATKIVEVPVSVLSQQKNVSGTMPTPPPAPPADVPLLIVEREVTSAPAATETPDTETPSSTATTSTPSSPAATEPPAAGIAEAPAAPVKTNPTTGSYLPLIGLGILGLIIVLVAAIFARGKSHA